ncbi:MAG: TIGR00341 family protein [Chloroflexi bacterium]|nr:TIGR00341 family protein [Chloroflexota bacterium]
MSATPETRLPVHNYYARTVVVPLGRPDTAVDMLRIAGEIVHPSEGLVIALVITLGNVEQTATVRDELQEIINEFSNTGSGQRVELLTEMADSVSRGILDIARERGADVIILGVQRSTQGRVKLGTVVENVIATAPCGVLIYRQAHSPGYEQVVVPVDGRLAAAHAVRLGVSLAIQHGISLQQLNVQHDYHYNPMHEAAITSYEAHLPRQRDLSKRIITSSQPAHEILGLVTADDLLVLGFSQKSDFERQITNDLSNHLLNQAPGPVILISQIEWHRGLRGTIEHSIARLNPQLTQVEQTEMIWSAQKNANSNLDYLVMIVLSAALATLGLLTNSAAVIIGAMLVAPLMSPLSSFSTGMASGIMQLTRRASLTLFQGVTLALFISLAMGLLLPIDTPTEEMLVRGSPNLLDAAIALVSGWVAAYATARKGIPAALAGVAIAAALMPPICTIGLGLALRDIDLAFGANLLFLANIAFIIAAQYITFLWMGMHPSQEREGASRRHLRIWRLMLAVVTLLVLLIFARLGSQAIDEAHIRARLEAEAFHGATVVEYHVITGLPLGVQLLVQADHNITPGEVGAAQELLDALYQQHIQLTVVSRQIVRPLDEMTAALVAALQDTLPNASISEFHIDPGEPLVVHAAARAIIPPSQAQLEQLRQEMSVLTGTPVDLRIAWQQLLAAEAPTPTQPATPVVPPSE